MRWRRYSILNSANRVGNSCTNHLIVMVSTTLQDNLSMPASFGELSQVSSISRKTQITISSMLVLETTHDMRIFIFWYFPSRRKPVAKSIPDRLIDLIVPNEPNDLFLLILRSGSFGWMVLRNSMLISQDLHKTSWPSILS